MKRILLVLNDYRRETHEAVLSQATALGWTLEFFRMGIPTGWDGDGAIIDRLTTQDLARVRGGRNFPVATITDLKGRRISRVLGDDRALADLGLGLLERKGLTRFIALDRGYWPVDPCARFCELAEARGHQARHVVIDDTREGMTFDALVRQAAEALRQVPAPCGLFLGGTHLAALAVNACRVAGRRIPDEVAIMTNDDDPVVCEGLAPGISAIAGEARHIGLVLATSLARMLHDPRDDGGKVLVQPDLMVERGSTAALAVDHGPTLRAIRHMQAHFATIGSIEDVAQVAGLSTATLREKFLLHVRRHPKEYLIDLRMQEALHLLRSTDRTLDEIATAIGYSGAMAFFAAFKKIYHRTPGEYRREHQPTAVAHGQ